MALVSPDILALTLAMAAVTFILRAGPLLLLASPRPAHIGELLRLAGPTILAAMAAVGVLLNEPDNGRGETASRLEFGIEALAVAVSIGLVAAGRSLLVGLIAAVALVAMARHLGLG